MQYWYLPLPPTPLVLQMYVLCSDSLHICTSQCSWGSFSCTSSDYLSRTVQWNCSIFTLDFYLFGEVLRFSITTLALNQTGQGFNSEPCHFIFPISQIVRQREVQSIYALFFLSITMTVEILILITHKLLKPSFTPAYKSLYMYKHLVACCRFPMS